MSLNEDVARTCGFLSVPDCEHEVALAMAAYADMRKRGWRITGVTDHPQRDWFCVNLVYYGEKLLRPADGVGATFPEALCRAVVEAGRRG